MKPTVRGENNEASLLIEALGPPHEERQRDNRILVAVAACLIGFTLANVIIWIATWPWIAVVITGSLTGAK